MGNKDETSLCHGKRMKHSRKPGKGTDQGSAKSQATAWLMREFLTEPGDEALGRNGMTAMAARGTNNRRKLNEAKLIAGHLVQLSLGHMKFMIAALI